MQRERGVCSSELVVLMSLISLEKGLVGKCWGSCGGIWWHRSRLLSLVFMVLPPHLPVVILLPLHAQPSKSTPHFLPTSQILLLGFRSQRNVDNYLIPNDWKGISRSCQLILMLAHVLPSLPQFSAVQRSRV